MEEMRATVADSDGLGQYALDLRGIGALVIYFALAALFLARGIVGQFSTAYIGQGGDPPMLMWEMTWWLHAIKHGLNPLFTDALWAPQGVNLTWTPNMPLVSVAAAPLIAIAGPVFSYNMFCLLAVALAAWCAFILCRYATGAYWPSLLGGYVFGFSAYMLAHTAADLNLILVFPTPLLALLLLRAMREDISLRTLVAGVALVLIMQFLLFIELFATMTLFVAIALIATFVVCSAAEKTRATGLIPAIATSYGISLAVLSPYICFMAVSGYERGAVHPLICYSTDLLNLLVPTPTMELGRAAPFQAVASRFLGNMYEAGGYVSVPLLLLGLAFARGHWRDGWGRLLIAMLIIAVVLSLGPFLLIAGRITMPLPGAILAVLPLLNKALPARLTLYAFLALGLMTSLWLATSPAPLWVRGFAAVLVILSTMPNLSSSFWTTARDLPRFFADGSYTKYLARGEAVVTLPYSPMLWQLESRWYYRMVGGYVGNPPIAFRQWPILSTFYRVGPALPAPGDQLKAFLATYGAQAVLVDDRQIETWEPLLSTLDVAPVKSGGIVIYRLPSAEMDRWKGSTALEMEKRACHDRFDGLVLAGYNYMRSGHRPTAISLAEVRRLGLLPTNWFDVPSNPQTPWAYGGINLPSNWHNQSFDEGMRLDTDSQGNIEVGVVCQISALRVIRDEFGSYAVRFSPSDLEDRTAGTDDDRRIMMATTFSRDGLARAAVLAGAH
jgi:hypothetical protein